MKRGLMGRRKSDIRANLEVHMPALLGLGSPSGIQVLVVIAAGVVTLITGAITIAKYVEERRRKLYLDVRSVLLSGPRGEFTQVIVANASKDNISLTDVGVMLFQPSRVSRFERVLHAIFHASRPVGSPGVTYNELADIMDDTGKTEPELVRLMPGEQKQIEIPMQVMIGRVAADQEAWPYAKDTLRRVVFAGQPAHINRLSLTPK